MCEYYQKNQESWSRLNQLEREARKQRKVTWTIHHADGSVTLQVEGKDRLKLEA